MFGNAEERRGADLLLDGAMASRLATVGLVLAAFALLLPWYAVDNTIGGAHSPLQEYSLTQKMRHNADGTTNLYPYETAACQCPAIAGVFGLAQAFAWTGALAAAGAFFFRGRPGKRGAKLALPLTLAAGALLAAAPILLTLQAPAAFLADGERVYNVVPVGRWGASFAGSHSENVAQVTTWGPALGWYAALAAGALTLAALTQRMRPVAAEVEAPAPVPLSQHHAALHPAEAAPRENAFVPRPG